MWIRYQFNAPFLLLVFGAATGAEAQVDPELAQRWFREATELCERDAGRLWGVSLCGPMVIFDPATGTRAASQPEPEGPPPRFPGLADGPVSWGGVRWFAMPLYLLPADDADVRQQLMLHGLFHRIQPELGLITEDGSNEHLDTFEGRLCACTVGTGALLYALKLHRDPTLPAVITFLTVTLAVLAYSERKQ